MVHGSSAGQGCYSGRNVLVLNDQGGGIMSVTLDMTATLRAQEHGHQPIVCLEAGGGYSP